MKITNYTIRLVKNNIEIEVSGDKEFVGKKFIELETKYMGVTHNNLEKPLPKFVDAETKGSRISIIEFINQKNPKSTATELMPALAYYAKNFEDLQQFNEDDMKNLYRRYDITKRPKNVYQAIVDVNRYKGYFESVPKAKGYFKLTEAGEHFVEVKLANN